MSYFSSWGEPFAAIAISQGSMIAPLLCGGEVPVKAGAKVMVYRRYTIDLLPCRTDHKERLSLHNVNRLPLILFLYGRSNPVHAEGD